MKYAVNKAEHPVYLQIYKRLRDDIVGGIVPYQSRLPSKRLLADEIGVSTITIRSPSSMPTRFCATRTMLSRGSEADIL